MLTLICKSPSEGDNTECKLAFNIENYHGTRVPVWLSMAAAGVLSIKLSDLLACLLPFMNIILAN